MEVIKQKILVWLPSPMGDAVLSTPALRAIRRQFEDSSITFLGNKVVRDVLSPGRFNDDWLELKSSNCFEIAKVLKKENFKCCILFKNSFASAFACFLARIPSRIGYAREGRGLLLTERLQPHRLGAMKFKPQPMIDYYLAIASWLGGDTTERTPELSIDHDVTENLYAKLPELKKTRDAIVVLVPGGAFGPSKCWPAERFAETADRLIEQYKATVIVSVSPNPQEQKIAKQICDKAKHKLINLGDIPVTLGELKSLFSLADLVITNDTGPRHIAIALKRKVITLFGPNSPEWTRTGYEKEIQIAGIAPCAPCAKPKCRESEHHCMEAISVEEVYEAAINLLENKTLPAVSRQNFLEVSNSFFIDPEYKKGLDEKGLTSFDGVFSFYRGENMNKKGLAPYRTRMRFEIEEPAKTLFMKRYDNPPISVQLKNWISHNKRQSLAFSDIAPSERLKTADIDTPKIIAFGTEWKTLFEKRSFCITEKISNAESLERKLPSCFSGAPALRNLRDKRAFISCLAAFVKRFHQTGYRHRDLYLSHIFYDQSGRFHLIDLARAFRPTLLGERFRRKDIAQLYYSAPGRFVSSTNRLRFYKAMTGRAKLTEADKIFIRKVVRKAGQMARHDLKHGKTVPYAN
ncbi:MAG: lipopolysaccharide heptosyltransferase II [Planctomycetota bacterium]|jgi:heptosyltransferase-2